MNKNREIFEGWTVQNFIDDLRPMFAQIMSGNSWQFPFSSNEELKRWCMDNQPYYKKFIPEVFDYFKSRLKEKEL